MFKKKVNVSITNIILSSLSSTPPCPGIKFEKSFLPLINQKISEISVQNNNILRIKLLNATIEVLPADDNMESWRILFSDASISQIVASNSWIGAE